MRYLQVRYYLLIMLALCMASVYAVDPILTGNYISGDTFTVAGKTYQLIGTDKSSGFEYYYDAAIFKDVESLVMIKVDKARCMSMGQYDFCYNESFYDWDTNRTYVNTFEIRPTMKINVYHYSPTIEVTRVFDFALVYGEPSTINITLKNTGSARVKITYEEDIPYVYYITSAYAQNNKVFFQEYIGANEEKTITYSIRAATYDPNSWYAKYSYVFEGNPYSYDVPIHARTNQPYTISETLSATSITKLNTENKYTISIRNNEFNTAYVDFSIITPKPISYSGGLTKKNNALIYEGSLSGGDSINFTVSLSTDTTGYFPIDAKANIRINNYVYAYKSNQSYNVSLKPLEPEIYIDKTFPVKGDALNVMLKLKNPDESAYINIVGTLLSDQSDQFSLREILGGRELIIYNTTYLVDKNTRFIFQGIYRTTTNQELSFFTYKDIIIDNTTVFMPPVINDTFNYINNSLSNQSISTPADQPSSPTQQPAENQNPGDNQGTIQSDGNSFFKNMFKSIDKFFSSIFG